MLQSIDFTQTQYHFFTDVFEKMHKRVGMIENVHSSREEKQGTVKANYQPHGNVHFQQALETHHIESDR
jgi:hypothetical protein